MEGIVVEEDDAIRMQNVAAALQEDMGAFEKKHTDEFGVLPALLSHLPASEEDASWTLHYDREGIKFTFSTHTKALSEPEAIFPLVNSAKTEAVNLMKKVSDLQRKLVLDAKHCTMHDHIELLLKVIKRGFCLELALGTNTALNLR